MWGGESWRKKRGEKGKDGEGIVEDGGENRTRKEDWNEGKYRGGSRREIV